MPAEGEPWRPPRIGIRSRVPPRDRPPPRRLRRGNPRGDGARGRARRGREGRGGRPRRRGEGAGDGLATVTAAWSAAAFAVGAGQSSRQSTVSITSTLLGMPGGRLLVVLTGLAVAGVGAFSMWSGWTRDFLVDLEQHPGRAVAVMGVIGLIARGVAFVLVGWLFRGAAWDDRRRGARRRGPDSHRARPASTVRCAGCRTCRSGTSSSR